MVSLPCILLPSYLMAAKPHHFDLTLGYSLQSLMAIPSSICCLSSAALLKRTSLTVDPGLFCSRGNADITRRWKPKSRLNHARAHQSTRAAYLILLIVEGLEYECGGHT